MRGYKYITSSDLPRFVGVPNDDDLLEDSSLEGIFGGRKISEVYASDTKMLLEAGVDWERASHVLNCLAVSASFHADLQKKIIDETMQSVFRGAEYWEVDEKTRKKYESEVQSALENMPDLPGFPGVSSHGTGARFQFLNPIKAAKIQGESRNDFELIADETPERAIKFLIDGKKVETTINYHTYYLATAHHLLEKGNRYELTGKQLAFLVKIFNQEQFDQKLNFWVKRKANELRKGLAIRLKHHEEVQFKEGTEIKLSAGHHLSIYTNKLLSLMDFEISTKHLSNIRILSGRSNIDLVFENGKWHISYLTKDYKIETLPIENSSKLNELISISQNIRAKSLAGSGRLLEGIAEEIKLLADIDLGLPETG
ncbi:MAG: hypothetical protein H6772_01855 [Pseudomonadales bacterium]|nr:hypothetical protein [Pseudomonadales bacterium]